MSLLDTSSETTTPINRPVLVANGVTSAFVVLAVWLLLGSKIAPIPAATAGVAAAAGVVVGVAIVTAFTNEGVKERWAGNHVLRFLVLFAYISATTTLLQNVLAPTAIALVAQFAGMLAAQAVLILRT